MAGGFMQYDEQANGHQVDAKLGEDFEVVLPETRTAGYRWKILQKGEPPVHLLEDNSRPSDTGVGGAGNHRWHFRAVAAGDSEIKLQYGRSWNESAEPARTFTLKVRVQ
jgi:predicted secreted protein